MRGSIILYKAYESRIKFLVGSIIFLHVLFCKGRLFCTYENKKTLIKVFGTADYFVRSYISMALLIGRVNYFVLMKIIKVDYCFVRCRSNLMVKIFPNENRLARVQVCE